MHGGLSMVFGSLPPQTNCSHYRDPLLCGEQPAYQTLKYIPQVKNAFKVRTALSPKTGRIRQNHGSKQFSAWQSNRHRFRWKGHPRQCPHLAKNMGKKALRERKGLLKSIGWQTHGAPQPLGSQWREEETHVPAGLLAGAEGCFLPSPGTQLLLLSSGWVFKDIEVCFFFPTKSQGQDHGHIILGAGRPMGVDSFASNMFSW